MRKQWAERREVMKKFIKKYPKRIITAFLIVLLIAVVGTFNNYKTYHYILSDECYFDDTIVEFMRKIYGEITVSKATVRYGGTSLLTGNYRNSHGSALVEMRLDSDIYAPDDTLKVTLENKCMNDIQFYKGKYNLSICSDNDRRWFLVHSGYINSEYNEVITLKSVESYVYEIPLNSVREVSDEPITLINGKYAIRVPLFILAKPGEGNTEDGALTCEFKIK